jgi:hypothetical protein
MALYEGVSRSGPWSPAQIADHLDRTVIPVRLGVLPVSGWPVVVSLWFVRDGEDILCTTQEDSAVARAVGNDPRCAFEIARDEPPYHGVRGRAHGTLEAGSETLLLGALDRYLGSTESELARLLRSRKRSEVTLRLRPTRLVSWDYRERMADSVAADS